MALGFALKAVLSVVTGTTVIVPVSYVVASRKLTPSPVMAYGENCTYLPIKRQEKDKLLVCLGTNDSSATFKWKGEDSQNNEDTTEVTALSWKRKADSSKDLFEMEIQLKDQSDTIKVEEDGTYYLPATELKEMEKNCSLKIGGRKGKFTFTCNGTDGEGGSKSHIIDTFDTVYFR